MKPFGQKPPSYGNTFQQTNRLKWAMEFKKEQEAEQLQKALKNNTHLTSFFKKAPKDASSLESTPTQQFAKNKIVCSTIIPKQ